MATKYLVLWSKTGHEWADVSEVDAAGQDAAVRQATADASDASGFWVAIPARSWKPVKIQSKTVSVHKLVPAAIPAEGVSVLGPAA